MDSRPIGIFDSGVGGLTALKELMQILPNEDFVYFGDTARVPYGSHSKDTIISFAQQDLSFLLSKNVKAILIACGTMSSTSLNVLRSMTEIPIIGVISAASKKAAQSGNSIAVLATQATISSHAFKTEILNYKKDCQVVEQACPLFVPLIENGYIEHNNIVTKIVAHNYTEEISRNEVDSIILGCTHYPIIRSIIQELFPKAEIFEAGKEAAFEIAEVISSNNMNNEKTHKGHCDYYTSEITDSFETVCKLFMGENLNAVINLVKFSQ